MHWIDRWCIQETITEWHWRCSNVRFKHRSPRMSHILWAILKHWFSISTKISRLTDKTEMHRMSEKLGNYLDKETEEDCAHHWFQRSTDGLLVYLHRPIRDFTCLWIPDSDFDSIDCEYIALSYRNDSGEIIGYCLGFESCIGREMKQRIWWLEDIFVEEKERGKGIGRKMISKMAKKGFRVLLTS